MSAGGDSQSRPAVSNTGSVADVCFMECVKAPQCDQPMRGQLIPFGLFFYIYIYSLSERITRN